MSHDLVNTDVAAIYRALADGRREFGRGAAALRAELLVCRATPQTEPRLMRWALALLLALNLATGIGLAR